MPTTTVSSSHGISPSTLGAILGSVLGTLLLLVLIAIFCLLRRARRRVPSDSQQSSSFWNRSTTVQSLRRRKSTTLPIWTGWEMVNPEDLRHPPSPGEGSPRGSGDEADPFLTRRSVRSGTEMEHARTDTDTLVSLPAIARTGSVRSIPKPAEHIIPRDVQMRLDEETSSDVPPYASVRMVERRSADDHETPLLPPPSFNSLGVAGARPSSHPSLASEKSKVARSITSEKSAASNATDHEPEGAELLTARRVHVGQMQPYASAGASTSTDPNANILGLDRLANLGRMSWFRRMSFLGVHPDAQPVPTSEEAADNYTRTPPRHSRAGSRSVPGSPSRPSSFAREQGPDSFGRRVGRDSGLAFGAAGERPISSVSAHSAASGNTVFYDASSRPGSSMGTRSTQGSGSSPIPPVPSIPPAHIPQPSPLSQEVHRAAPSPESVYSEDAAGHPSAYDVAGKSEARSYTDVDVLDMPVPRPASPFSAASGLRMLPPGLVPLPSPAAWRNSHASSTTPATDTTSGVNIDVLEDAPPAADGTWRHLAGGAQPTDGRRLTFGVVSSSGLLGFASR